jgi:radical SAM protein with 4Fe4S-binding SPASM domain
MRGVSGAEEAALRAFRLLAANGFPMDVEMAFHKKSVGSLRESINLLAKEGLHAVKASGACNMGAWNENGKELTLGREEALEAWLDYIPYFFLDGSPLDLCLGGLFAAKKGSRVWRPVFQKGVEESAILRQCVCGATRNCLYISPEGRALPCMPMASFEAFAEQFPVVQETGLARVLTDSPYFSAINTRVDALLERNPKCAACPHKYICLGGCRVSAMEAAPDDYLAIDTDMCHLFEEDWAGKIERRIAEFPELSDVKREVLPESKQE